MIEFATFPPEINSGRMYAGPGAGPMIAACAAWDALADDLYLAAAGYGVVVSDLASSWLGPSSVSMASGSRHLRVMDHRHRRAGCTNRRSGHGGRRRLRGCVRHDRAAAGDCGQPLVAAGAGRDKFLRSKHPGDHGHRGPLRRDVGAGCRGDVRLRRRVIGSSGVDAIHNSAGNHELLRVCRDGRCGDTSRRYLGRHGRPDSGTIELRGGRCPGIRINDGVDSTSTSPLSSLTTLTSSSAVTSGTSLVSGAASSGSMSASGVSTLGSAGSLMNAFGTATGTFAQGFQMSGSVMSTGVGSGAGALSSPGIRRYSRNRDRGPGGVARSDVSAPGLDLCCAGIQPGCLRVAGRRTARCAAGDARQSDESDGRSAVEFNGAGRRQFSLACPLQLPSRHGATAGIRRLRRWGRLR